MNCKPNDMAMVIVVCGEVANPHTGERLPILRMGVVVHVVANQGGEWEKWTLADPVPCVVNFSDGMTFTCECTAIADACLRPLPKPWECLDTTEDVPRPSEVTA